jgi:hypothetical protein
MKKIAIFIYFIAVVCLAQDRGEIERGDFNFDGKEDYRVFIMVNGRKMEWQHFLFDPNTGKHVPYEKLDALWNPTFDPNNKTVSTFANGGHAGQIYTIETYVWDKGKLKLIEKVSQDWNSKKQLYYKVTLKRIDGEMTLRGVELLTTEEVPR